LNNIRRNYVKSCNLQFRYFNNPIHFECRRHKYSKGLQKISQTAGLIRQASVDEVKTKLASLLAICYSLLFVAFSLILLFIVTWVYEYICVSKFQITVNKEYGKDTPEIT
jgi:hypothetical protein